MFEWKASNGIILGAEETGGKGRQFKARFLVPGLVKYDYGVCLLTKENADKFIQEFVGCPVVIDHQDVTDDNVKEIGAGDIFSVWFDDKDGYYWCNGIIRDKKALELINQGYSVSCQYVITEYSDNTTGALHNGNPYDKVIENGRPEHLAIVKNPRYEGAIIAVNAIMATNEDRWITIHPNGEDEKGRHLLLKDGETPKEAIERTYGKGNKSESKEKYVGLSEKEYSELAKEYRDIVKTDKLSPKQVKRLKEMYPYFIKDAEYNSKDSNLNEPTREYYKSQIDKFKKQEQDLNSWFDLSQHQEKHMSSEWKKYLKENPKDFIDDKKQPDKGDDSKDNEHAEIKEYLKKIRPDLHFNYNKNSKNPYEIKYREGKRFNLNDIATSSDKKEDILEYLRQQTKPGSDLDIELTAKIKEAKENKATESKTSKKYTYSLTKKEVGNDKWLGGMADTGHYYTNGSFAIDKRYLDIKGQEPKKINDIDNAVKKMLTETAKKKQKEENYTTQKDFELGELKKENGKPIKVAKYSYYDDKLGYTRNIYIDKKFNDLFKNFELKFGSEYSPVYAYDGKDLIGVVMPIAGKDQSYTASNSFIEQFKVTLYTSIAEGIYNRLGE